MASGLLASCQSQLAAVLKKLDEATDKLGNLTQRIECLEDQVAKQTEASQQANDLPRNGKRKRSQDALTIQVSSLL